MQLDWADHGGTLSGSRHPKLRKRIETVFSQLVEAQIRSVQTKTLASLRFRTVLAVLAHNLTQP